MARLCTCCTHPDVDAMRAEWIASRSARAIAAGRNIDFRAVHRCMKGHLPRLLAGTASVPIVPQLVQPVATIAPEADAPAVSHVPRAWQLDDVPAAEDPQGSPPTSASAPPTPSQPTSAPAAPSAAPANGMGLLQLAHSLRDRALGILTTAEAAGDNRTALQAIREARGVLESLARLEPAGTTSGVAVPLAANPEWHAVRGVLVAALAPHPEAALAVADALEEAGLLT